MESQADAKFKGLQAWLCRKTGMKQGHLSNLMNGNRRVTPENAKRLEPLLLQRGINLTRIDLVFGYKKGQSWRQLLESKEREGK